jgi:3-oxoacyl-[acyl-carrier protein] reductase
MSLLADKRIVITGASGGIGAALARTCAREGALVGVGYGKRAAEAEALAARLTAEHGRAAQALRIEVREPESIAAAVSDFIARHGRIDGWVDSAAVSRPGLLVSTEVAALTEQLEVNLLGPLLCARAVLPRMMRQKSGVLLHIGSVAAVRPTRGQAGYAASKGGLEALTRALAVEYARKGVRVLCLRLGPVDTPMLASTRALAEEEITRRTLAQRIANADEVAEHAVFLLSERARFATGSIVTVDGGYQLG